MPDACPSINVLRYAQSRAAQVTATEQIVNNFHFSFFPLHFFFVSPIFIGHSFIYECDTFSQLHPQLLFALRAPLFGSLSNKNKSHTRFCFCCPAACRYMRPFGSWRSASSSLIGPARQWALTERSPLGLARQTSLSVCVCVCVSCFFLTYLRAGCMRGGGEFLLPTNFRRTVRPHALNLICAQRVCIE